MKKFNLVQKIFIFVILIALSFFAYNFFVPKPTEMSYADFIQYLGEKKIINAFVNDEKIVFFLDGSEEKFFVQNPKTPDIVEKLLLSGSFVKIEQKSSEIFTLIFDIIFYGIFIFAIIFAFKRFISPSTFKIIRKTNVKFDDIVGMEDLKKSMIQIAQMMKNSNNFKKQGIRMPKGILLEGAPGNGKTLFARALAGESAVNFIAAKATDFQSMFMSIGPAKVKMLFRKARKNAPCIVFIDEFDGIGTKRNYSGSAIETENTRIVTALLNELDGFTVNDGVLILAATNSRTALDEALIRPGRFDVKYTVPYPDKNARIELIIKYGTNKSLHENINVEKLADKFSGFSCAHIESVLNRAAMYASQENQNVIELSHIEKALKEL
ncbi:MAG: AAA family ATPase [Treponema sp.]|nr:AAA family ATPase [Treponema sp.]